jgi:hypothetical protein
VSKKSSPFNDTHLKFSSIGSNIKRSLCQIEEEIKLLEAKDVKNLACSNPEKKAIYVKVK